MRTRLKSQRLLTRLCIVELFYKDFMIKQAELCETLKAPMPDNTTDLTRRSISLSLGFIVEEAPPPVDLADRVDPMVDIIMGVRILSVGNAILRLPIDGVWWSPVPFFLVGGTSDCASRSSWSCWWKDHNQLLFSRSLTTGLKRFPLPLFGKTRILLLEEEYDNNPCSLSLSLALSLSKIPDYQCTIGGKALAPLMREKSTLASAFTSIFRKRRRKVVNKEGGEKKKEKKKQTKQNQNDAQTCWVILIVVLAFWWRQYRITKNQSSLHRKKCHTHNKTTHKTNEEKEKILFFLRGWIHTSPMTATLSPLIINNPKGTCSIPSSA